jgi:hypothetical protein
MIDYCFDFFCKEDIERFLKTTLKSIVTLVYNDVYLYLWIICFYSIFLLLLTLANFLMLIWIRNQIYGIRFMIGKPE